jgi:two-component system chemotaxis response regulator CheB
MPKAAFDIGAVEYQEKINDIANKTYAVLNNM